MVAFKICWTNKYYKKLCREEEYSLVLTIQTIIRIDHKLISDNVFVNSERKFVMFVSFFHRSMHDANRLEWHNQTLQPTEMIRFELVHYFLFAQSMWWWWMRWREKSPCSTAIGPWSINRRAQSIMPQDIRKSNWRDSSKKMKLLMPNIFIFFQNETYIFCIKYRCRQWECRNNSLYNNWHCKCFRNFVNKAKRKYKKNEKINLCKSISSFILFTRYSIVLTWSMRHFLKFIRCMLFVCIIDPISLQ